MAWVILTLVIVALLVVAAVVIEKQRSAALKRRFGPEYERVVDEHGDRARRRPRCGSGSSAARPWSCDLPAADVERYRAHGTRSSRASWTTRGQRGRGRNLVDQVMADRGYHDATADTDDDEAPGPVELVAVDHPELVANYRTARTGGAAASLDDLRATFVHYRELFEAMLVDGTPADPDGDGDRDDVRFGVTQ